MDDIFKLVVVLVAIIGMAILGFGAPSLLLKWSFKKTAEKLEPIAAALGGEIISGARLTPYLLLHVDKFEARVEFGNRQNEGQSLILRLMTAMPFGLEVASEDTLNLEPFLGDTASKILRNLASKYEFQIGDQAFDDKYFLVSKNPDQAREFLLPGPKREIVDYFFKNGFTRLGFGNYSVYAEKTGYGPDDLEPWTVRYNLGQLNNFVSG